MPPPNVVRARARVCVGIRAAMVCACVAVGTTSASAHQCPKLIHEIYAEAWRRFDRDAYDARKKAADAARLHREDCHGQSQRIANEGRKLLGLEVKPVKGPDTPSPGRPCF